MTSDIPLLPAMKSPMMDAAVIVFNGLKTAPVLMGLSFRSRLIRYPTVAMVPASKLIELVVPNSIENVQSLLLNCGPIINGHGRQLSMTFLFNVPMPADTLAVA